jgi:hypothetical protein
MRMLSGLRGQAHASCLELLPQVFNNIDTISGYRNCQTNLDKEAALPPRSNLTGFPRRALMNFIKKMRKELFNDDEI